MVKHWRPSLTIMAVKQLLVGSLIDMFYFPIFRDGWLTFDHQPEYRWISPDDPHSFVSLHLLGFSSIALRFCPQIARCLFPSGDHDPSPNREFPSAIALLTKLYPSACAWFDPMYLCAQFDITIVVQHLPRCCKPWFFPNVFQLHLDSGNEITTTIHLSPLTVINKHHVAIHFNHLTWCFMGWTSTKPLLTIFISIDHIHGNWKVNHY